MPKTIRAVQPNAGLRVWYQKRLERMTGLMNKAIARHVESAVKRGFTAVQLQNLVDRLHREWQRKFDEQALDVAERFVNKVDKFTTSAIKNARTAVGFDIGIKNTEITNNVLRSLRETQVSLIQSIPKHQHLRVTEIVQTGVQNGRDIHYVQEQLQKAFGISSRRARMIAIDQNNKATQSIRRAHDEQAGITEGIWLHIPGRKTSRKTHIAMNGKRFKLDEGLYDKAVGYNVMPGECVNCCCQYRAVIPKQYLGKKEEE